MKLAPVWKHRAIDAQLTRDVALGISRPVEIAQILVGRGFDSIEKTKDFLSQGLDQLRSPYELAGVDQASEKIASHILQGDLIFIHGDFDADGITSAALFDVFLHSVGAKVHSFVPNRLVEGHGISIRSIEMALEKDAKLFVTCDCGSSDLDQIQALRKHGVEVIITDHHQIPNGFDPNVILVNPQNQELDQAWRELSGVGVVFVVIMAVRKALREKGYFTDQIPEPNLKELLDIVALGTIADMAPLTGQNRTLVVNGLKQLATTVSPGITAMMEKSGLDAKSTFSSSDVGFRLAPRINAAARLGYSEQALELLRSKDLGRVFEISDQVERWNHQRKQILDQMMNVADSQAKAQIQSGNACVWIASKDFHPGLVGLLAQKLSKTYHAPAFIFTLDGEVAKGSARCSGAAFHLVRALEACSEHLHAFGGHREAGGCSLPAEKLDIFQKDFFQYIALHEMSQQKQIEIDASPGFQYIHEQFLAYLHELGPFGIGNPEPVFFAKTQIVGQAREVGSNHLKMNVMDSSEKVMGAMGFNMWQEYCQLGRPSTLEILFFPEYNVYRGRREIYLRLLGIRV
ncbi:MAG: single-stranded-DNA-specific exonuclease RecJ [Bdellovibrionota bacterium]